MTRAYAERDGDRFSLSLEGHATGSVEVCAAVSCLIYSLAGYIRSSPGAAVECLELASGKAVLAFRGGAEAKGAFEAAVVGLLQLAAQYPEQLIVEAQEIS